MQRISRFFTTLSSSSNLLKNKQPTTETTSSTHTNTNTNSNPNTTTMSCADGACYYDPTQSKVKGNTVVNKDDYKDLLNSHAVLSKDQLTDEFFHSKLTPEQYHILREKGTERAFTGEYYKTKDKGVYKCRGCNNPLFLSDHKFDSGTGWPSFYDVIEKGRVATEVDNKFGWSRTEVLCHNCNGHLGHVFDDGPNPTGLRYCINSASILLDKKN